LDEASHLDGKHVVFGTVTGPTVFNALRIGQVDVDEQTMQPTAMEHAPRIERVKIIDNPIHTDIVPTALLPWKAATTTDQPAKKKKKRKGVKNVNVLSFGDEMQDDEGMGGGIQSSHDVIASGILSKEVDTQLQQVQAVVEETNGSSKRKKSKKKRDESDKDNESSIKNIPEKVIDDSGLVVDDATESAFKEHAPESSTSHTFVSSKRKEPVPEPPPEPVEPNNSKPEKKKEKKLSLVEMRRAKYANKGAKDKRKREEDTMAKLMAFQSKIVKDVASSKLSNQGNKDDNDNSLAARMARKAQAADKPNDEVDDAAGPVAYHGQVLEDEEEGGNDWLKTRFKCRKHMDHDAKLGGDGRNAMDYEVVDDLAEDERKKQKRPHHQHQHRWHKGSSGKRDKGTNPDR
jgi:peptidyl-prolyl cis-trans isomerase SDCCAG10